MRAYPLNDAWHNLPRDELAVLRPVRAIFGPHATLVPKGCSKGWGEGRAGTPWKEGRGNLQHNRAEDTLLGRYAEHSHLYLPAEW